MSILTDADMDLLVLSALDEATDEEIPCERGSAPCEKVATHRVQVLPHFGCPLPTVRHFCLQCLDVVRSVRGCICHRCMVPIDVMRVSPIRGSKR